MGTFARKGPPFPWLKPAVFVGALVPIVVMGLQAFLAELPADPIAYILNRLGALTLIFLLASLACSPMKTLFGWTWPIRLRRMLGLFAFAYGVMHFAVYLALDQFFDWAAILEDLTERKFITVGFAALVLMIPLAVTSTNAMVKRLGFPRWKALHRLAYVSGVLGVFHFIWRVKQDITEPALYASVLITLLAIRVLEVIQKRRKKTVTA